MSISLRTLRTVLLGSLCLLPVAGAAPSAGETVLAVDNETLCYATVTLRPEHAGPRQIVRVEAQQVRRVTVPLDATALITVHVALSRCPEAAAFDLEPAAIRRPLRLVLRNNPAASYLVPDERPDPS